ncbi:MAG: pilus assembly protein CpaE [Paracoccaceae bacterium]|jgi:pilus assembly protein CpaE
MSGGLALKSDPAPIVACTIARNVQTFDLLIDDMETELGEAWGDLTFEEARGFLAQPEANGLEFVAFAVDDSDEKDITLIGDLIKIAKDKGIKVILIAEDVSPIGLHQMLKIGADDFVPYPLPENALHDAIERIREAATAPVAAAAQHGTVPHNPAPKLEAHTAIFAVQSLAGGTGSTTLAVNLAWELANIDKKTSPSVCLMDFDLQFGSASTFLDLPRRDVIFEVLSDSKSMDVEAFKQALVTYNDKLSVFTAPADILPLDMIGPDDIKCLLDLASQCFDIIVIDMPTTVVQWTESVLMAADVYFATLELDMRSAQNAIRFTKAMRAEDLPLEKVHFVLNRSPKFTDLSGKNRVKRMAESLNIEINTLLPDGGKLISQACDHGIPLAEMARKSPLRKEILKVAQTLHAALLADSQAASK